MMITSHALREYVWIVLIAISPTLGLTSLVLQITVYDQEHFQGRRMEFTACCQNIMECGMENIRSLKVECGAYVTRDILPGFVKPVGTFIS